MHKPTALQRMLQSGSERQCVSAERKAQQVCHVVAVECMEFVCLVRSGFCPHLLHHQPVWRRVRMADHLEMA